MDDVMTSLSKKPLTSFIQVKDKKLCDDVFRFELYKLLRDDMMNFYSPTRGVNPKRFDIDFLHPSNLQDFYKCDNYELKARKQQTAFFTTTNKEKLYKAGLKYIYDQLGVNNTQYDFNSIISGIKVFGYSGKVQKTVSVFAKHVTCEIIVDKKPVFQINSFWFKVKNNFIEKINSICIQMIKENYLHEGIVSFLWDDTMDEDAYNIQYHDNQNYWVFINFIHITYNSTTTYCSCKNCTY